MNARFERSGPIEVTAVVAENANSADVCVLYPADATEEQLKTIWVRAEEADYICIAEMR